MEIVECPVCLEVFQNPKILPTCFHTLCGACAKSLTLNKTINCPLCRTKNAISKELAPNYIVQQLLDSKKINVAPKPKVFCESEDGNVATIWCEKCDYCYCEECWSKIHAVGKFKTHSKQPVEDKQREKNNKIPMCLSHQNYTCDFYCKTCSSVICNICWVDSHKHPHEVFSIYNCSEEVRKNLLETVTTSFSNETNATNNNVTDHRNKIKKNEELIAQKRAEIENLSQEIVGFQKVLDDQLLVLEQSKANQELVKELIQQQKSVTLLDPNSFSQLESQISEIFSSLFKKTLALNANPQHRNIPALIPEFNLKSFVGTASYTIERNHFIKKNVGHCGISLTGSFTEGTHILEIEYYSISTEGWLLLGTQTKPACNTQNSFSEVETNGINVNKLGNGNHHSWIKGKHTKLSDCQLKEGEKVEMILNCDEGLFTIKSARWEHCIPVPKREALYFHFNPHSASFKIVSYKRK